MSAAEVIPMPAAPRPRLVVNPKDLAVAVLESASWKGKSIVRILLEVGERLGAGISEIQIAVQALVTLGLLAERQRQGQRWFFRVGDDPRKGRRGRG